MMIFSNCIILLLLGCGWTKAFDELVWLEDINNDFVTRNLDLGLPENLEFNLNRVGGKSLKLRLSENKRLNSMAPVYESVWEGDKQTMVLQSDVPILTTKFYHDKSMGAAVKVTCSNQLVGACQRTLDGSLNIDGDPYEIEPERNVHNSRSRISAKYVPHTIRKVSDPLGSAQHMRGYPAARFRYFADEGNVRTFDDGKDIPDNDDGLRSFDTGPVPDEPIPKSDIAEILTSLLRLRQINDVAERLLTNRATGETPLLAVELVVVIDPIFWENYYAVTSARDGMNREKSTRFVIREKLAHIINGVSLRYESIDDPELDMYVTISRFMFYKKKSNNGVLPASMKTFMVDGIKHADCDLYLDHIKLWANQLEDMEHDDHIMVFSGYELIYDMDTSNDGVLGVAFVGGACGKYRVSLQQDGDYFKLTSVAAHELGHNLGSSHDGSRSSSRCSRYDKYIMAPSVASFSRGEPYSINPWVFSPCSIQAFKDYIGSGRCFTDHGDYYNKNEWELHNSKLPGELYTLDEQCKLTRGETSGHCTGIQPSTSEAVCRTMLCEGDDSYCYYYAAARGSSCGHPSDNKWCIDGLCTFKNSTENPGNPGNPITTDTPTEMTTEVPTTVQSSTPNGRCIDFGWRNWTCVQVSQHYESSYTSCSNHWCQDPYWSEACCAFCAALYTSPEPTTTATPCVDSGWNSWSCQRLSKYLKNNHRMKPKQWCLYPDWQTGCCKYCQDRGF